jgi:hypothetical protein
MRGRQRCRDAGQTEGGALATVAGSDACMAAACIQWPGRARWLVPSGRSWGRLQQVVLRTCVQPSCCSCSTRSAGGCVGMCCCACNAHVCNVHVCKCMRGSGHAVVWGWFMCGLPCDGTAVTHALVHWGWGYWDMRGKGSGTWGKCNWPPTRRAVSMAGPLLGALGGGGCCACALCCLHADAGRISYMCRQCVTAERQVCDV